MSGCLNNTDSLSHDLGSGLLDGPLSFKPSMVLHHKFKIRNKTLGMCVSACLHACKCMSKLIKDDRSVYNCGGGESNTGVSLGVFNLGKQTGFGLYPTLPLQSPFLLHIPHQKGHHHHHHHHVAFNLPYQYESSSPSIDMNIVDIYCVLYN